MLQGRTIIRLLVFGLCAGALLAQPVTPLTNADIVKLVHAGLSAPVVLEKIRSSAVAFDLSVDAMVGLRKAGVPDAVIAGMLAAQPHPSAPPDATPGPAPRLRSPADVAARAIASRVGQLSQEEREYEVNVNAGYWDYADNRLLVVTADGLCSEWPNPCKDNKANMPWLRLRCFCVERFSRKVLYLSDTLGHTVAMTTATAHKRHDARSLNELVTLLRDLGVAECPKCGDATERITALPEIDAWPER